MGFFMLPESYQHAFDRFQRSLQRLQQATQSADRAMLQSAFQATQELFQQQIAPLDLEALDPKISLKARAIQVEINKQMRLLATDLLFLQAARQPTTASQRQQQIGDRVEMLLRYCVAVMEQQ
jgi:mannose/cellobiose epimerase-like protein (N-acyl-D-glucosamine 2-epimerase family)